MQFLPVRMMFCERCKIPTEELRYFQPRRKINTEAVLTLLYESHATASLISRSCIFYLQESWEKIIISVQSEKTFSFLFLNQNHAVLLQITLKQDVKE